MKAVYIALGLLVLFTISGQTFGQANQTCTLTGVVTPVYNFTLERFLGEWHGHKIYRRLEENVWPLNFTCLSVQVERTEEGSEYDLTVTESYTNLDNGEAESVTGYATLDAESPAIWNNVGFTEEGERMDSTSVCVQTDYENWTLSYNCRITNNYRYEIMSIQTRDPNPDPVVVAILEKIVEGYGFPPTHGLPIDQSSC